MAVIATALALGMYCAAMSGWGPVIYTLGCALGGADWKLFEIRPL